MLMEVVNRSVEGVAAKKVMMIRVVGMKLNERIPMGVTKVKGGV